MNRSAGLFFMFVLAALYSPAIFAQSAPATPETREIKVTAKRYEFSPNPITVKKGEHVKLLVAALDHDHGFKLDAFNINLKIKKGATASAEFTADKAGTFPFHCSDFCGMGHRKMKGKLVVEE
jgi:cytochrome c oxidase subunit II